MARPKIPDELKKKHRRDYMREYMRKRRQQSFDEVLKTLPSPLTPSVARDGGTGNNTAKGA
jgi:hypothetical protein